MITNEHFWLCGAAFLAGFIDSMVGGGGLIQLPAFLLVLPHHSLITALATNKLVSMTGTAVSTYRFSRQMPYLRVIIVPAILSAFAASFVGAFCVTLVDPEIMKILMMSLLFLVFLITIRSKSFGTIAHDPNTPIKIWKPLAIGGVLGFYDGFFGPGTGSLLIIAFVGILGMTYVQGSGYAKIINLSTNLAAILMFSMKTKFLFSYALPMMLFNVAGALLGVRLALLKGNTFVRGLLRGVILATIVKLAYDVIKQNF